ncbi:hypothetical protein D3C87_1109580 [compost metagenome]
MVRVGLECDELFLLKVVDDPLHVLPIGAKVASEPSHRLRMLALEDGAENLPAGARQSERRDKPVAGCHQAAIESEKFEHQAAHRFAGRGSLHFWHMSL